MSWWKVKEKEVRKKAVKRENTWKNTAAEHSLMLRNGLHSTKLGRSKSGFQKNGIENLIFT